MASVAAGRLAEDRKKWRLDHPFGFIAKPKKNADGTLNLFEWECAIPGKKGGIWEGGLYKLTMSFGADYPHEPPVCCFNPPVFHPNVYFNGKICLSTLHSYAGWHSGMTIKQILLSIQQLLDGPNTKSPAGSTAARLLENDRLEYERRAREYAVKCSADVVQKEFS